MRPSGPARRGRRNKASLLDGLDPARHAGAPVALTVPGEGAMYFTSHIGITKGTKHKDLAKKFLDVALSPEAQLINAQEAFLGPGNSQVKLTGALADSLAYGDRLKTLLTPD